MAALGTSSAKPQKRGFVTSLASSVLEWLLILFLLVNATLSLLVVKFARYCKLQTLCFLCSRLHHVFASEKLAYYWDLIYRNLKSENASLGLCHAHNELFEVWGMCEICLFSLLVEDTHCRFDQDPFLEGHKIGRSSSRHCCRCNEPWGFKGHSQKSIQNKSFGWECAELDVPLSGVVGVNQDDLKMGCTHLKASSDTGSEVLHCHEDASASLCETDVSMADFTVRGAQLEPLILTPSDDPDTKKLIIADPQLKDFPLMSRAQLDPIATYGRSFVAPTVALENRVEEINWQQVSGKASSPASAESDSKANSLAVNDLSSLVDVIPSSNAMETTSEVWEESYLTRTGDVGQTCVAQCGNTYDAKTAPPTSSETGPKRKVVISAAAQPEPNSLDMGDSYRIAGGNRGRPYVLFEQQGGKDSPRFGKDSPLSKDSPRVGKDSPRFGKDSPRVGKDSPRVGEDLRLFLSQLYFSQGIEQSMNEKSPRLLVTTDDLKTTAASNSLRVQTLQKRISLEHNESGVPLDGSALQKRISLERSDSGLSLDGSTHQKRISLERNDSGLSLYSSVLQKRMSLVRNESSLSLDGSIVSEIEDESTIDRVKQQIEHDRKHVSELFKELEEERNASAVAANEAMAMINKLQDEKATLLMEALQCLRLMEEESQYDTEALQKATDLLSEQERELQDLEAELELYRNKFGDESILVNVIDDTHDRKATAIRIGHSDSVYVEDGASHVLTELVTKKHVIYDTVEGTSTIPLVDKYPDSMKNALVEFEDERLHILQCLNKLEKKLYSLYNNGVYLENGGGNVKSAFEESSPEEETQENGAVEKFNLSMQDDINVFSANLHARASPEKAPLIRKDISEFDSSEQGFPVLHRGTDLASIGNIEVSDLNGSRLEGHKADRSFFEHTVNPVKSREEGLQVIREIASHLRELGRIGPRTMRPIIA